MLQRCIARRASGGRTSASRRIDAVVAIEATPASCATGACAEVLRSVTRPGRDRFAPAQTNAATGRGRPIMSTAPLRRSMKVRDAFPSFAQFPLPVVWTGGCSVRAAPGRAVHSRICAIPAVPLSPPEGCSVGCSAGANRAFPHLRNSRCPRSHRRGCGVARWAGSNGASPHLRNSRWLLLRRRSSPHGPGATFRICRPTECRGRRAESALNCKALQIFGLFAISARGARCWRHVPRDGDAGRVMPSSRPRRSKGVDPAQPTQPEPARPRHEK